MTTDDENVSGTFADSASVSTSDAERIPPDAEYWLALSALPGIGRGAFLRLIELYHAPKTAWEHRDADWQAAGLERKTLTTDGHRAEALAWAKTQIDKLAKSEWSLLTYGGSRYPAALSQLHYPAPYLFLLGTIPDAPSIAVVGSRRLTEYGARVTRLIAGDLAAAGVTIVSGFARGIDTIAHTSALEANGKTVAVWGCGPDEVYPEENEPLVQRIVGSGGIITEFPFGTPPEPQNFPVRNRLIAGLSDGVLVVQARQRSGALLTAQHALEQGKDVYAIPGEIGQEQFVGTHDLLKQGARYVTTAADILSTLGVASAPRRDDAPVRPKAIPPLTDIERRVYDAIGGTACHIDPLSVSLRLPVGECARVLTLLELKGLIIKSAGNMIARSV